MLVGEVTSSSIPPASRVSETSTVTFGPSHTRLPTLVADARVPFRIDTDLSITEDGWHIDDIVIRGFDDPPPGLIFYDHFESGDTSTWSAAAP